MNLSGQDNNHFTPRIMLVLVLVVLSVLSFEASSAQTNSTSADSKVASEWTTYRHDNRRSGVTTSKLNFPLSLKWVYRSPLPPQMADVPRIRQRRHGRRWDP